MKMRLNSNPHSQAQRTTQPAFHMNKHTIPRRLVHVQFQSSDDRQQKNSPQPTTTPANNNDSNYSKNPLEQLRVDFSIITNALVQAAGRQSSQKGGNNDTSSSSLQPTAQALVGTQKQQQAEIQQLKSQLAEQEVRLRASRADVMESRAAMSVMKQELEQANAEKTVLKQQLIETEVALADTRSELEALADDVLHVFSSPTTTAATATSEPTTTGDNSNDNAVVDTPAEATPDTDSEQDSSTVGSDGGKVKNILDELTQQMGLLRKRRWSA